MPLFVQEWLYRLRDALRNWLGITEWMVRVRILEVERQHMDKEIARLRSYQPPLALRVSVCEERLDDHNRQLEDLSFLRIESAE